MADRRRNNGPPGGTKPLLYSCMTRPGTDKPERPSRTRAADELRKVYLKRGVTPPASGSAYLELESSPINKKRQNFLLPSSSTLKLSCAVHGPKPLPRSAAYSPHLAVTCYVKFTPFATRHRRGYLRDPAEKDISTQLESALRGVIIGERYPKTGVDVCITILEGEEDRWWGDETMGGATNIGGWGLFSVLAGCVTVASAALVDAGIDCIDLVTGGTAAIIGGDMTAKSKGNMIAGELSASPKIVVDPNPTEHEHITAACVVGYIASRDETTLLWTRGAASGDETEQLIDAAVSAASATRVLLADALTQSASQRVAPTTT